MTPPTQPRTRDLGELVDALSIAEDELRFQVERLTNATDDFLVRMREQYASAIGALVTLRRYQQGRLDARRPAPSEPVVRHVGAFDDAIDAAGRATAYTGDEDDT